VSFFFFVFLPQSLSLSSLSANEVEKKEAAFQLSLFPFSFYLSFLPSSLHSYLGLDRVGGDAKPRHALDGHQPRPGEGLEQALAVAGAIGR